MNRSTDSRRPIFAMGAFIAVAGWLGVGCETHVIGAKGIGASSTHPTTSEPAGSDPLSKKVWGNSGSQP